MSVHSKTSEKNQLQTAPKNRHRSVFDIVIIYFTEDELQYSIFKKPGSS